MCEVPLERFIELWKYTTTFIDKHESKKKNQFNMYMLEQLLEMIPDAYRVGAEDDVLHFPAPIGYEQIGVREEIASREHLLEKIWAIPKFRPLKFITKKDGVIKEKWSLPYDNMPRYILDMDLLAERKEWVERNAADPVAFFYDNLDMYNP